jgi:hypothetical protein
MQSPLLQELPVEAGGGPPALEAVTTLEEVQGWTERFSEWLEAPGNAAAAEPVKCYLLQLRRLRDRAAPQRDEAASLRAVMAAADRETRTSGDPARRAVKLALERAMLALARERGEAARAVFAQLSELFRKPESAQRFATSPEVADAFRGLAAEAGPARAGEALRSGLTASSFVDAVRAVRVTSMESKQLSAQVVEWLGKLFDGVALTAKNMASDPVLRSLEPDANNASFIRTKMLEGAQHVSEAGGKTFPSAEPVGVIVVHVQQRLDAFAAFSTAFLADLHAALYFSLSHDVFAPAQDLYRISRMTLSELGGGDANIWLQPEKLTLDGQAAASAASRRRSVPGPGWIDHFTEFRIDEHNLRGTAALVMFCLGGVIQADEVAINYLDAALSLCDAKAVRARSLVAMMRSSLARERGEPAAFLPSPLAHVYPNARARANGVLFELNELIKEAGALEGEVGATSRQRQVSLLDCHEALAQAAEFLDGVRKKLGQAGGKYASDGEITPKLLLVEGETAEKRKPGSDKRNKALKAVGEALTELVAAHLASERAKAQKGQADLGLLDEPAGMEVSAAQQPGLSESEVIRFAVLRSLLASLVTHLSDLRAAYGDANPAGPAADAIVAPRVEKDVDKFVGVVKALVGKAGDFMRKCRDERLARDDADRRRSFAEQLSVQDEIAFLNGLVMAFVGAQARLQAAGREVPKEWQSLGPETKDSASARANADRVVRAAAALVERLAVAGAPAGGGAVAGLAGQETPSELRQEREKLFKQRQDALATREKELETKWKNKNEEFEDEKVEARDALEKDRKALEAARKKFNEDREAQREEVLKAERTIFAKENAVATKQAQAIAAAEEKARKAEEEARKAKSELADRDETLRAVQRALTTYSEKLGVTRDSLRQAGEPQGAPVMMNLRASSADLDEILKEDEKKRHREELRSNQYLKPYPELITAIENVGWTARLLEATEKALNRTGGAVSRDRASQVQRAAQEAEDALRKAEDALRKAEDALRKAEEDVDAHRQTIIKQTGLLNEKDELITRLRETLAQLERDLKQCRDQLEGQKRKEPEGKGEEETKEEEEEGDGDKGGPPRKKRTAASETQELEELQFAQTVLKQQNSELIQQNASLSRQIDEAKLQETVLKQQIAGLVTDVETLQKQVAARSAEVVTEKNAEIDSLKTQLAASLALRQQLEESASLLALQLKGANEDVIPNRELVIRQLSNEVSTKETEAVALRAALAEKETEAAKLKENIKAQNTSLFNATNAMTTRNKELEELRLRLAMLESPPTKSLKDTPLPAAASRKRPSEKAAVSADEAHLVYAHGSVEDLLPQPGRDVLEASEALYRVGVRLRSSLGIPPQ